MYVLRISRYRECLGHDRWVFDSASMHLLHLNLSHIFMCSLHQYKATRIHFGCECNAHSAQIQCNVGTKKRSERTPNNIIHTHRHNAALEHARPILPEHTHTRAHCTQNAHWHEHRMLAVGVSATAHPYTSNSLDMGIETLRRYLRYMLVFVCSINLIAWSKEPFVHVLVKGRHRFCVYTASFRNSNIDSVAFECKSSLECATLVIF